MHEMIRLSYYKLYLRIWKLYIVAHRVRGGDRGLLAAGAGLPPPILTATDLTFTAIAATLLLVCRSSILAYLLSCLMF